MLVDAQRGDIFGTTHIHIVFAVNTEGYNDAGFAGLVSSRYWPQLADTGGNKLGDVLIKQVGDHRTFHALVCHELSGTGWKQTPHYVEECLNKLDVPEDETLGVVLMGSGPIGQMGGADVFAIIGSIARSKRKAAIYTL